MTDLEEDTDSSAIKGLSAAKKEAQKTKGLPPIHLWNPPFHGDIDMRIAADGTWYYLGSPINRKPMVKLFSTVLLREDDRFFLVTPVEKVGITVDDAPFVAVGLTIENSGKGQILRFRTNVDDDVCAGPDNVLTVSIDPKTQEPRPYIHVRSGLNALINRAVFYDLVELGVEHEVDNTPYFGVWSANTFFPIAPAEEMREG